MSRIIHAIPAIAAMVFTLTAVAGQIIYPAEGQSSEMQQRDQGECQVWATENTGVDPAILAQTPIDSTSSYGGGERARGATVGAIGGLAIGAITGHAGRGAAIGAVTGTMVGGRQARYNQASRQQYDQYQRQEMIDTWYRAIGACMTARGYTVG